METLGGSLGMAKMALGASWDPFAAKAAPTGRSGPLVVREAAHANHHNTTLGWIRPLDALAAALGAKPGELMCWTQSGGLAENRPSQPPMRPHAVDV
jgi:hypothetical protein